MLEFKVIQDVQAVKGDVKRGQDMQYRHYPEGKMVAGYEHPDFPGFVVVDEVWVLPARAVSLMGELQEGQQPAPIAKLPTDFQAELDNIKGTSFVKSVMDKSRNAMTWTFAGGMIGFFFALATRKNIVLCTVISAAAAGVIGYNVKMPAFNLDAVSKANNT